MEKAICRRFKEIEAGIGLKGSQFADSIEVQAQVVSDIEREKREPSKDVLLKIALKHSVNLHWMLTGEGEMFLPSVPAASSRRELAKPTESHKVPLLRQKVSCGPGLDWQDENNIVDYIDVFDRIPRLKIERLFALCVEGSSMLGAGIRNGDYVLFDSAKDQWPHDGIYVFALDGEVYCKRLEFDMTKIKIYSVRFTDLDKAELMVTLDSEDTSTADRLTIFGRVLYWVHPNDE
ncbi:MAG: helix-turn-helix domain-containing protein [Spirochaetaceae bacterium]|jgi:phage repressor protein C with HTH and peptisase S24 domain|nr:helix-turn-helix domain-containing protein [Spirochaetaceae bacterium]